MGDRLCIEAPSTVTGLGPGLGTLGLVLEIVDVFRVELDPESATVEGDDTLCTAYRAWPAERLPGARFTVERRIPPGKGLGEEVALTVAGLAAGAWATKAMDAREQIVRIASDLSGDAAGSAACVLGGLTAAYRDGEMIRAQHVANHLALDIVLFLPDSTEAASTLPDTIPSSAALADLGRLAYMTSAIIWGRWEQIGPSMENSLLGPAAPTERVITAAREAGAFGASLVDRGPSIIALVPRGEAGQIAGAMQDAAATSGWTGQTVTTTMREAGVVVKQEKEAEASV